MTNDVHYWCKPLRDVRAIVVATVVSRVRKLWSKKTIMIIDEVSMMGLSMLSAINGQCKIVGLLKSRVCQPPGYCRESLYI